MSLYAYIFWIVLIALFTSLIVTIAMAVRIFENQDKLSKKIDKLATQLKEKED